MTTPTADVLASQPRVAHALQAARELAAAHNDTDLLAIAERRIGELLGVEPPASLPSPESVPETLANAVVTFVEQWVVDVANITDDMVATLRAALGEDQLMNFLHGVLLIEQRIRLDLAWTKLGLS